MNVNISDANISLLSSLLFVEFSLILNSVNYIFSIHTRYHVTNCLFS